MFKKLIALTAILFILAESDAQPIKTPQPSTTQNIKQDFGIGTVELSYSRPNMKGRKIFGDLVPFGKVWRTGANNATTITFTDTVLVGNTKLAPGKYGLLTIPNKDEWTVIFSKQTNVTSPADYKQESDAARINVKPSTLKENFETFTMQFGNIKNASLELQMIWDNVAVNVPISTDVESKVLAQINNVMNNDNRPYFQAAMFYMETGRDLNQAVAWLDKAYDQNKNAFWVVHQKANALAKLGKKEEARAAATKSMAMAKEAKNDDYVELNKKLLDTLK
jgi:tetratricopeptide (TPR) repeat protein